jgi:hypothetical protein
MSSREREQMLRQAYAGFNARDVESVLALMHPEVDWPNAMEDTSTRSGTAWSSGWTWKGSR